MTELIKTGITPDFVRPRTALTWREVLFGIDNELLSPGAAVDFALERLAPDQELTPALVELAGRVKGARTRDLVERLAAAEPPLSAEAIQGKWLYLVLAWVFENRDAYREPLSIVEEIYADFGYPVSIATFVRYMPANEPDLGSKGADEKRLFEKWGHYLETASRKYGRQTLGTQLK